MSKSAKYPKKELESKEKQLSDEIFAYRSVKISGILGGFCFVISIFFNIEIINIFMNKNIFLDIVDVSIKVATILLFFFFMMISIGNYKELIGKPSDWKDLLILFAFSLGQTLLNPWVFIFTLLGLILILIYLYIVQEI